jgi:hypothetical protein
MLAPIQLCHFMFYTKIAAANAFSIESKRQTLWAKRGHLSQQQSLTYVLKHKTVAYFLSSWLGRYPGVQYTR